jgi:hypothetical protein
MAWLAIIPTTFGTGWVAVALGGVPAAAWQGDNGVVAVGPVAGSTGTAVLVDGADAISSSTFTPRTAKLRAVGDWARTVPGGTWADTPKWTPTVRPAS